MTTVTMIRTVTAMKTMLAMTMMTIWWWRS